MDKKVYAVLGAGLTGPAVAYALSVLRPNATIWIAEINSKRAKLAKQLLTHHLNCGNVALVQNDPKDYGLEPFSKMENLSVISTLPYYCNKKIAKECISKGWKYYDLGGHINVSNDINAMAIESSGSVLTDLGLAPGFVNILAENSLNLVKNPHTVNIFCGGLPCNPKINELGYGKVFSADGLINEYFNKCHALIDQEIKEVPSMGDVSLVTIGNCVYESFNTSGAAHTTLDVMKNKGVKNFRYQTLRYPGHAKIFRFLKKDIGMVHDELVDLVEKKIPYTSQDKVIVGLSIEGDATYKVDYEIKYNRYFTAMARATGFSVAAAVTASEKCNKNCLTYGDVDYKEFIQNLTHKELLSEIK